jgi:hypothetical protein
MKLREYLQLPAASMYEKRNILPVSKYDSIGWNLLAKNSVSMRTKATNGDMKYRVLKKKHEYLKSGCIWGQKIDKNIIKEDITMIQETNF